MFCPNCGSNVDPAAQFCPNCGAQLPRTFSPTEPAQPQLPMKWFKFLINFSLWASAVLNIIGGIGNLFAKSLFMEMFVLDKAVAVATIALGAFSIYTRFRLAGFRRNGPQMLLCLYTASAVINFAYMIGVYVSLGDMASLYFSPVSSITSIIVSLVMIGVNNVYFQKRSDLFIK